MIEIIDSIPHIFDENLVYYALPFTKQFPIPQLYPSKALLNYYDRNHRLYPSGLLRLTFY